MDKYVFTVTEEEARFPLKRIIKKRFSFSSRFMTKIKYQNLIKLNGETVPGWVVPKVGDLVSVSLPEEASHFEPEDIPIDILYEDDDLLFINKNPGLTVHPTKGHPSHTMANALMKYELDTNQNFKIRFVNRLDMDTSGILIVAKNSYAQAELNKQMSENITEKKYTAVAEGIIEEDDFIIDKPIGLPSPDQKNREILKVEDGGYESQTGVKVLKRFDDATLIECKLFTGRTHQIRVHLSSIGHPLIGDPLYGNESELIKRQALHASSFSLIHPVTKKRLLVEAPLPMDIIELIDKL